MSPPLLLLLVIGVVLAPGGCQHHDGLFYPFGLQEDDKLPYGADVSSPEIRLRVPVKFFDDIYDSLYVNGNGLISFLTEVPTFFNVQFPLEYPVIAPLYTHVDTTRSGTISYRETDAPDILDRISDQVNRLYPNLVKPFTPLSAFVVTWDKVGYFDRGSDKVNTYQAVISTDGDESFVELLYPPNGIQWVQGISKGQGLPDARAQAGIVAPDGRLYTLRGSGTDQIKNLDRWTNADAPGVYMFRIGNTGEKGNVELPQASADNRASSEDEPKSCMTGSIYCHSKADCFDTTEGFCCKCQPKYYGNGRNCFMDGIPLRVNGKVNISVNNISVQNLDLQAYVVTTDGRSYTAVSQMPQVLGPSMQLVESLGGVIAWLFARPINDAKNGFQLTGGILNHTVSLQFDTNHRILVKQRYLGLDVYDQLKMESEVTGTLPFLEQGTVLKMPDFQAWFSKISSGVFRSQSEHVVQIENSTVTFLFQKDETIEFNEYCSDANQDFVNLRLKSARNFILFDTKEGILRFSSTNKVSKSSGIEDPCIEGHAKCVANSSCIAQEDTFKCVCNPGFETLYNGNEGNDIGCVDVNECAIGTAGCDVNAICVNEIGSYNCQCKPGFSGDGRICEDLDPPCARDPTLCEITNGACDIPGDYNSCNCFNGFRKVEDEYSALGFICQDIDECQTSICHVDANCYNTVGSYVCTCKQGFYGDGIICTGEQPLATCQSLLCPENSICTDEYGAAKCICDRGYIGEPPFCRWNDKKPIGGSCINLVCPVGSYCVQNGYDEGRCICEPGYNGEPPYCERDFNRSCSSDAECSISARCLYDYDVSLYRCKCLPGYSGDGYDCQVMEGPVVRTCNGDECWCPTGYREEGDLCIKTSSPKEPQKEDQCASPCSQNAKCIYLQRENEYICKCNPGFEGNGETCTELEISCESAEICDKNAFCQFDDTNQRYICICDIGFEGDGTTCYPTGECMGNNDCTSLENCEYNEQSDRYECMCRPGYSKVDDVCVPSCEDQCHHDAKCIFNGDLNRSVCLCNDGLEGDGVRYCQPEPTGCERDGCASPHAHCVYDANERTYMCRCYDGYEGDGANCNMTCYVMPEMCGQDATCSNIHGSYQCRCNEGFVGNGVTCKEAKPQEEFLLINQGRATLRVPFSQSRMNRGYPIQIHQGQTAIGIAIDCVDGRVYWSDIANQAIRSSKYDGTDIKDFSTIGISSPEGLTIDWINRNIYWTDSEFDTINMANLETGEGKVIASVGLVNPRGIAVHPWMRKLFWSDWNRDDPKIECSDLNGDGRRILLRGPHVSLPNSLAIDWTRNELCWADAGTQTIECLNILSETRRTVVKECQYPFGLAITSDKYYWTDWKTHKIEVGSKENGHQLQSLNLPLGGDNKLYGITAVTKTCPQ